MKRSLLICLAERWPHLHLWIMASALALILWPSIFPGAALLAQGSNASISGTITDHSDAVVPKAKIAVRNRSTGAERTVFTNESGMFSLPGLTPGEYDIRVEKNGFQTLQRENVTLEVATNAQLNLQLRVGDTATVVTIEASAETLQTTNAEVSTVVNRKFVENIPLNGRSMQSLITMAPGVIQVKPPYGSGRGDSGQFSVNGLRTESNYFTVDGASGNRGVGANGLYGAGAAG